MTKLFKLCFALITGVLLTSCSGEKSNNTINLAYVNWAEGVAMAQVTKVILEDNGYQVKMMNTDAAPLFASLAKGSADVFLETWMPVTHHDYMEKYGDKIEVLGTDYDNAKIGLVVPEYVSIHSIEELNAHKNQFKSEIVGIDAGAGIMQATEKAIEAYALDFNLLTSSEAGMTATLKKAIDKKEWIVVTGWTPHWIFSRYKMKMLDDPKKIYGDAERIEAVARKGFREDQPWVAEFISHIKFTDDQIGHLMDVMDQTSDEAQAAKDWVAENQDLINTWLPEKDKE